MKNLSHIVQSYLGVTPKDQGCESWTDMQSKMEEEINEFFRGEVLDRNVSIVNPTTGECKITNDKFSWVLEVDGKTILFQGSDAADYFAGVFAKLGYKIVWDRDKWKSEE